MFFGKNWLTDLLDELTYIPELENHMLNTESFCSLCAEIYSILVYSHFIHIYKETQSFKNAALQTKKHTFHNADLNNIRSKIKVLTIL